MLLPLEAPFAPFAPAASAILGRDGAESVVGNGPNLMVKAILV